MRPSFGALPIPFLFQQITRVRLENTPLWSVKKLEKQRESSLVTQTFKRDGSLPLRHTSHPHVRAKRRLGEVPTAW
jgi:hypothetical protein